MMRARLGAALCACLVLFGCEQLRREYPVATEVAESVAQATGQVAVGVGHVAAGVWEFFTTPWPGDQAAPGGACGPIGPEETRIYTVRGGDTLAEVAACFGVPWEHLARINDIPDPDAIAPGQELRIYGMQAALPRARPPVAAIVAVPKEMSPKRVDGIDWQWPVAAGRSKRHPPGGGREGITITGRDGQSIYAAADGKVAYSDAGPIGYGQLVILQHARGFLSTYGHNSELLVREGQRVRRGDVIALMGRTSAPRAQLHFGLRLKGVPVNPMRYLPEPGGG